MNPTVNVIGILGTSLDSAGRAKAIVRLRDLAENEPDDIDARFYESSARALELYHADEAKEKAHG